MADASTQDCPDLGALEEWRLAANGAPHDGPIGAHLASCALCRARIESLEQNDAALHELRAVLAAPSPLPTTAAEEAPDGYDFTGPARAGGQGVVRRAIQRSTRREVAIKVIHRGAEAGSRARARFEREAELIARLRHPNVVNLFDAGVTPSGALWLAMEWIEGEPLDDFVQRTRPDARAVVELLAQVCDGIGAAHRRGLIHRDIKPSNILIDAEGRVRALDFGVARALTDSDAHPTRTGEFLGTLAFASPEQIESDAGALDTRSDVYAIGALAYLLLAGRMPYDVDGSIAQTCRNIREADPPRLTRSPGAASGADADLDAVVARALAKEPARRYGAAGELGDDLRRWLDGRPVAARADSAWYLLVRAARRRRAPFAAAGAVALALVLTTVVSLAFWRRSVQDRLAAESQAAQKSAVVDFLSRMFSAATLGGKGRDARVADVLEDASAELADAFPEQPAVRRELHAAIGGAYLSLGLYDEADANLGLALELARVQNDPRILAGAASMVAQLRVGQSRLDVALALFTEAIDLASGHLGPDDPLTLSIRHNRAIALAQLDRHEHAESEYRDILARRAATLGPDHSDTLGTRAALGMLLIQDGRLDDAAAELTAAIDGMERTLGPDSHRRLTAISNLALALLSAGRAAEAEALYRDALPRFERVFGTDHPTTLLVANNLAGALWRQERFDEVAAMLAYVLAAQTRTLGTDHLTTLTTTGNLGALRLRLGDLDAAEPLLRACYEGRLRTLGEDHRETVHAKGRLDEALRRRAETPPAE